MVSADLLEHESLSLPPSMKQTPEEDPADTASGSIVANPRMNRPTGRRICVFGATVLLIQSRKAWKRVPEDADESVVAGVW